jgi:3-hydroxyisobutyrate dehydrogenase
MASRLISAGHHVTVFNRSPEAARPLVELGAHRAPSPREAVAGCDAAICCVRDDAASREVWLDDQTGALASLPSNAVAVESSTLSLGWARELGAAMSSAGLKFLDAPVVGSRPQADAGELIFLVGGEAETLEPLRELLLVMGGAVHRAGPVGSGTAMKLAVNALFGIQIAALAEALALLRSAGVDEASAVETLSAMPIASPAMKGVGALMAKRAFEPLFPIELVEKDFGYVVETGEHLSTDTPTAAAVRGVYRKAIEAGFGGDNIHGVLKLFD